MQSICEDGHFFRIWTNPYRLDYLVLLRFVHPQRRQVPLKMSLQELKMLRLMMSLFCEGCLLSLELF
jgi:hypothetical protein